MVYVPDKAAPTLWLTAGSSSYEVIKATIQAEMLTGRYCTELFCSYGSQNKTGVCLLEAAMADKSQKTFPIFSETALN